MDLQPGDKVSFLNEKRDGTVVRLLNNKMVLIEIEDGFNIPVLASELIKIQVPGERHESSVLPQKPPIEKEIEPETRFAVRKPLLIENKVAEKIQEGLYLTFVPENPENILSSFMGVYLINHNPFDTLFTYSLKENEKHLLKDFDKIDEQTALLLSEIKVSEIEKWSDIHFHFMFYKQDAEMNKPPIVCEMHVNPVRFYKEENYSVNTLLNEKCFLVPLTEKKLKQPETWPEEKWEKSKVEKPGGIKVVGHIKDFIKVEPFPEKYIKDKGIAVVDLHIQSIAPTRSGMNSDEIKRLQLHYFATLLDRAITHKFRKITFIHGVGDGRLKEDIIQILKKDYPDLNYQEAPHSQYGFGATEVIIIA